MRYQLYVIITPEVEKHLGGLIVPYAKQFIQEVVNMDMRELNKVPMEEVQTLYQRKDRKYKGISGGKELYEKWHEIPWALRKHAYYLIHKKLLEVEL